MKNAFFWDVSPCGPCNNQRFGGTYRLHHQGDMNRCTKNNVSRNKEPTHTAKKYLVKRLKRLKISYDAIKDSFQQSLGMKLSTWSQ
jgi:hypothetical protein